MFSAGKIAPPTAQPTPRPTEPPTPLPTNVLEVGTPFFIVMILGLVVILPLLTCGTVIIYKRARTYASASGLAWEGNSYNTNPDPKSLSGITAEHFESHLTSVSLPADKLPLPNMHTDKLPLPSQSKAKAHPAHTAFDSINGQHAQSLVDNTSVHTLDEPQNKPWRDQQQKMYSQGTL